MDIRDLRYAVTTLDAGSFAQAAERLYVSRQALSQAVKRLESEAGLRLFGVQGGNRLVPTPEGATFLAGAREVIDTFDGFLEQHGIAPAGAAPGSAKPQRISLALSTGVALSLPSDFFTKYWGLHPTVVQEVEETTTDGALELLDEGRADIALVGSYPGYLERYESCCAVPTGLWLAVPLSNPLSERDHLELKDLAGQTIVTAGRLNHLHRYLTEACEQAGISPNIPTTSSNPALLVRVAQECSGMFFAFPPHIGNSDDRGHNARVLPLRMAGSDTFGTYLVRPRGTRPTAAAREFWAYAAKASARQGTAQ